MEACYVGESFEIEFKCTDTRDPDRTVDEATYKVVTADGAIMQGGVMSVAEDGHTVSFRFEPREAGPVVISVSYRMGQDRFTERFNVSVRE